MRLDDSHTSSISKVFFPVSVNSPIMLLSSWQVFLDTISIISPSPLSLSHQVGLIHSFPTMYLKSVELSPSLLVPPSYRTATASYLSPCFLSCSLPSKPLAPPYTAASLSFAKTNLIIFPPDQNPLMVFDPSLDKVQTPYSQQGST